MGYAIGTVLFCGGTEHEAEAREYIKINAYTSDDVKLVRRDDWILVVSKREIKT